MIFVGRSRPSTTSKINTKINFKRAEILFCNARASHSPSWVTFRILGQDDPRLCHRLRERDSVTHIIVQTKVQTNRLARTFLLALILNVSRVITDSVTGVKKYHGNIDTGIWITLVNRLGVNITHISSLFLSLSTFSTCFFLLLFNIISQINI